MNTFKTTTTALLLIGLLAGCTSTPMTTENLNEDDYTVIGKGQATATGIMLFQVIPIQQNDRFVRAQRAAIKSKGGDAMINTEVQETWFWGWILNGFKTTVSGDVVKMKNN